MTVTVYRDDIRQRSDGIYIKKRMHEEIDYPISYAPWLAKQGELGDTISTSEWEYPDGISLESTVQQATLAVAWISGGTPGERYQVVNKIVTVGGRTIEQAFYLEIDRRE